MKTEFMPKAANEISAKTEWVNIEREFTKEVKDYSGGPERWVHMMNSYIADAKKPNDTRSPREIYEAARINFDKDFGYMKKSQKKVIPLESPGKQKEREVGKPEKQMTIDDWNEESREYVKFKEQKMRELQET